MFIADNLEISVIAIAKTLNQEKVNENHLLIAACEFLCKHEAEKCTGVFKKAADKVRKIESSQDNSGFQTPVIPPILLSRIERCVSVEDVITLAEECVLNTVNQNASPIVTEPSQITKIGDFHAPNGPDVGFLRKIVPNKDVSAQLISPFLMKNEFYSWDGPYNTKDSVLSTQLGQSMGRLFVTNLRILFWSDDLPKPHVGLFYDDIQGWKSSWMPMKSRGVIAMVAGRKVIFAANSSAIENAERFINGKD